MGKNAMQRGVTGLVVQKKFNLNVFWILILLQGFWGCSSVRNITPQSSVSKQASQGDSLGLELKQNLPDPLSKSLPLDSLSDSLTQNPMAVSGLPGSFLDTSQTVLDSLPKSVLDSLEARQLKEIRGRDQLDTVIVFSARDSVIYDITNSMIYLHGQGKIDYQEFKLDAPEIAVDMQLSTLKAYSGFDSLEKKLFTPRFKDSGGDYEAARMAYNFKTKRGKISQVYTEIDQGYYRGEKIKRRESGELFVKGGRYTTCDHEHPHYWFYGSQMKIIPGDRVISRPLVLYVEGVPMFILPFMFFPTQSGKSSGIVIPKYGFDNTIGYNISQGGYYWYINDYMDWLNEGDISLRGSWRLRSRYRYAKRYEFRGSIDGEFQRQFINEEGDPDFRKSEGWNLNIDHNHDFDPYTKAKLNLKFASQNTTAYNLNSFDPYDIISQQATSYANFSKTFAEGQRSLNMSYQRTQRLDEKNLSQSLSLSLYQGQFYPFRPRKSSGDGLFEKIAVRPGASASGSFNSTDAFETANYTANTNLSLSLQQTFAPGYQANFSQSINATFNLNHTAPDQDISGLRLTMPLSVQSTLFNYVNLNTSFTLNKFFVDRTVEKFLDLSDTTVVTTTTKETESFYTFSLSTSMQTRLYGVLGTGILDGLIGLKALRHTFVPNLSYSYTPDFSDPRWGYYKTYLDENGDPVTYNRFESALFRPGSGESQTLGINISNIFEAKASTFDSTKAIDDPKRFERTFQFLTLSMSTSYNFAADSLNLAPLSISASTTTLAPHFSLNASATYDFYDFDKTTGAKINKFYVNETGSLLRLVRANFNVSSRLQGSPSTNRSPTPRDTLENGLQEANPLINTDFNRELGRDVDYSIPWNLSLSLNMSVDKSNPIEPTEFDAQLSTALSISPTPNWQLSTSLTYNFSDKEFSFPTIYINRDLHCWQMNFQWTPIGTYRSYFFQIGIKSPQLQDVRIEKRDIPVAIFED
jgi:lipopolysaccharide assembly outer membrane protein LptD (OstA)